MWGGQCDPAISASLGAINGSLAPGCFLPHQDIIVPPAMYEWNNVTAWTFLTPYLNEELRGINRTHKLFYSGHIGGSKRASLHPTERSFTGPWPVSGPMTLPFFPPCRPVQKQARGERKPVE